LRKSKEKVFKFGVNPCSLCEKIDLTVGEQSWGGIRWCQECLKQSLGWFQLKEDARVKITLLFDKLRQHETIKQQLKDAEKMSPEDLKHLSIGEARFRCMDSLKYGG
jgi:hypothetical protein